MRSLGRCPPARAARSSSIRRFLTLSLLVILLLLTALAGAQQDSGTGGNNNDDGGGDDTGNDTGGSGNGDTSSTSPPTTTTSTPTSSSPIPSTSSTPAPTTTTPADDNPSNGLPPGTTRTTTTALFTALPSGSLTSGTPTSTSSSIPAPTYTNVTLDLSPSYQSNVFLHQPLPDAFYGSAAHTRVPDIYFRDCNFQASDTSLVSSDFRINVTSVYSQFDEDLDDPFMGRRAPTKGTLRIVAVGEIGAQAHAADNVTNYLSAISVQTNFLTFPVFSNLTYLCDRIFPTTADQLNPLITPTSCAYGPGPVAFGVSIPINSPYYLGTLNTQLRLSDPSKPARNIACISVNVTPYHPSAWYWHLILWLPIATFITLFVLAALARLLTALSVLRARFANRAREGTGPSWVRDKLRPTLAAAMSGEHLRSSAGLVRFASPGCWDVIWHLQFVTAIGMMAVHWPDWAYPFLKQAAWASLLGNVTVLNSEMSVDPTQYSQGIVPSGHIDVLRTYAALPAGDIGDQMRDNVTSPIYMNTDAAIAAASHSGQNRFLNLNNTAYGIPRFGYMLGLNEQDIWPTAVIIWLYILAGIVALSFVLWVADAIQAHFERVRIRRQADDYDTAGRNSIQSEAHPINGVAGGSRAGTGRANESSTAGSLAPPRSPAASTSASLNFGTGAARGQTSAGQSPGGGGGGLGKNGDDGFVEHLHLTTSASALTMPSNAHFAAYDDDGGENGQVSGNKEADLASPGHAHLPGSPTTRWGQYRFLGSLGSTGAGLSNASGQEKHKTRRLTRSGGSGAPAKLHLSHLHGNVIRVVALFHFPLTILSVWGLQSHHGAHSTVQRALAALFFVVVCLLIPLYASVRIWFASRVQLYEDMPTFTQLGPLYNSYAPGAHRYVVALFAWTLIMGIVIGAAQSSGSAQALVLLIFETGMSIATNLWLPWGEGANMGPAAFIGSVLRIITAVLLVLLSPLAGFGGAVAGWITYVVLVLQAIWFVGVFLIVLVKVLELIVRVVFNVPYEEGTRRAYNGLEGAIKQIRRRQDKILQLGSRSSGAAGLRRPGSRASGTGSSIMHNMAGSPGGGGAGMQSGGVNRPIPLTHSRQVSYASYLDNPRMNAQAQHRLSQQAGYGSYAGYFHQDPHDEGGIMAAMPPSSPGLGGTPGPFPWNKQNSGAAQSGGGPNQRSPVQTRPSSSGNGGTNPGSSPPSTGFVRLGGGRATDTQPWQSIPNTGVSAQSPPTNGADPATAAAAAVAAARRRPRPQSQTAVVESYNWMDQGAKKAASPQTSPRAEILPLPDHRSSFNALANAQRRGPGGAGPSADPGPSADSAAAVGAAGAPADKTDKRGSVGGGLFGRKKKKQGLRRLSEGHVAEDSFDEEEEDEEDEGEEEDPGEGGAGGYADKGGKSGGVFSGFSRFVGGLRSNPRRRSDVDAEGARQSGFEMEEEASPKQTGFEVVRKPRRPVAFQAQTSGEPATSNAATAEVKKPKAEPAATDAATATPGSPLGDGSLPPQTDLGKLNAGLGLDFNANPTIKEAGAADSSSSPSRNRLAAATPTTAEVKRWSETPSEAEIRTEIEKASAANNNADSNAAKASASREKPTGVPDETVFWRS